MARRAALGKTVSDLGFRLPDIGIALWILALTAGECSAAAGTGSSAGHKTRSALSAETTDAAVAAVIAGLDSSNPTAALEAVAKTLASWGDLSAPVLEAIANQPHAAAPASAAELLWLLAQKRQLTDRLAAVTADLLEHDDPFARALAEWAIAIKAQTENGGQEIRWPRPDPPDWFRRWMALTPEQLLEADYARLAIGWGVHHKATSLSSSCGKIVERARGAAAQVAESAPEAAKAMAARQLAHLEAIRRELAERAKRNPNDILTARRMWIAARRAARPIVLANPAVNFGELVFITRHSAHSHRNITGSQYPWVHKPGGDICVKSGLDPAGEVRRVLNGKLGPGHVHGIDLWWAGDRVVFGWAAQRDWPPPWDTVGGNDVFRLRGAQTPTHIYEINLDGTGLRQVTAHPYWSDFEPTYCPDGRIVFASDRSGRSSECGKFSADHTVINIYSVSADGSGLRRLSDNKDIDRYPHSLDDGSIAYTRWEYQERHFHEVHSVWTVRPDGTMADAVFKQHFKAPHGLRDTRSVPGGDKLISIATGHHTFAYGPVVLIDPSGGPNASDRICGVTPHSLPQEGPPPKSIVPEGGVPDRGGLYQTPWALSDRLFLVSYSHALPPSGTAGGDNASGFALYLIDVHGNKELIHRDLIHSCAFPMPLRRRPRPPILSDVAQPRRDAACYVADVYQGMEGVPRGTVKHLRICQRVGWPLDDKIGAMRYIPGNAWERQFGFWAWAPARVIGTAPVAADGSAYFRAPVDTAVYFQALDEQFMEVRRMRSHISFQAGETRGCIGCHETKPKAPPARGQVPLAILREPVEPQPPAWGADRLLGYEWLIQPIFDTRCVACHGGVTPDGGLDLTAAPTANGMFRSYLSLFGRRDGVTESTPPLVSVSNRFDGAGISQPKQFGSHQSRLIQVLLEDELHRREARLTGREWIALVTWVDLNAPYYDTFYNRRPTDGGAPRRDIRLQLPSPFATTLREGNAAWEGIVDVP